SGITPCTSALSPATLATMEVIGATVVATFSFRPFNATLACPTEAAEAGHVKEASLRRASADALSPLELASAKSLAALAEAVGVEEAAGLEERPHPAANRVATSRTAATRWQLMTRDTASPPLDDVWMLSQSDSEK